MFDMKFSLITTYMLKKKNQIAPHFNFFFQKKNTKFTSCTCKKNVTILLVIFPLFRTCIKILLNYSLHNCKSIPDF